MLRYATLFIEPGVEVRFSGRYEIAIEGGLVARGTAQEPILFTRHSDGIRWKHLLMREHQKDVTLEFVSIEYAETGIAEERQFFPMEGPQFRITNSIVRHNGIGIKTERGAAIKIIVTENDGLGVRARGLIDSTVINNGGVGVYASYVANSTISGNGSHGIGSGSHISGSNIMHNGGDGIAAVGGSSEIKSNTIEGNAGNGITVGDLSGEIANNNIVNNKGPYALRNTTRRDIRAPNNWWGTTERGRIEELIFDFYDDPTYQVGKVYFEPFLTAPVVIPSPTPVPSPVPPAICDWTGQWETIVDGQQFGMSLFQRGADLGGTYGLENRQINGTAAGERFTGRWAGPPSWREPGHAGRFVFVMAADCNSFTGSWGFDQSTTDGGVWSGTRVTGAAARAQLVTRLYQELLCRDPDPEGLGAWAGSNATEAQLRTAIGGSPEGLQAATVRSLYLSTFGRDPSPQDCGGMRGWVDSGLGAGEMRAGLEGSPEGQRVRAVRGFYVELLGRDPLGPDNAGLRGWIAGGLSLEAIRAAIMQSPEYRSSR